MDIPKGWMSVDAGMVAPVLLFEMIEFIIDNEMQGRTISAQFSALRNPYDLTISRQSAWGLTALELRRLLCNESLHPLTSKAVYSAHFAFRDVNEGILFKMKFA